MLQEDKALFAGLGCGRMTVHFFPAVILAGLRAYVNGFVNALSPIADSIPQGLLTKRRLWIRREGEKGDEGHAS